MQLDYSDVDIGGYDEMKDNEHNALLEQQEEYE